MQTPTAKHILCGDFNASWQGDEGGLQNSPLEEWASTNGWINPCWEEAHKSPTPSPCTRYSGERPTGWIDHILTSGFLPRRPLDWGVVTADVFHSLSDHRPLWITLPFGTPSCIPRLPPTPPSHKPTTRMNTKDPSQVAAFAAHVDLLLARPGESPLDLYQLATACVRAERHVTRKASVMKHKLGGWSPVMLDLLRTQIFLSALLARIDSNIWGEAAFGKIHRRWRRRLTVPAQLDSLLLHPNDTVWAVPQSWGAQQLRGLIRTEHTNLRRRLQGRHRHNLRLQISAAVRQREQLRAAGRTGRVIQSMLGEDRHCLDLRYLREPGGSLLSEPREVHNLLTSHFKAWYACPSPYLDWVMNWEDLPSSRTSFCSAPSTQLIPAALRQRLWAALTSTADSRESIGTAITAATHLPPSLAELTRAIACKPPTSAAGQSGLSYAHLKCISPRSVEALHIEIGKIWTSRSAPTWWRTRVLVPIPKGTPADIPVLDDLRPLMLLEVLRKLCMGMLIARIRRVLESHKLLSSSQYGFRPRRSCPAAVLQVINAMEASRAASTDLFITSWDIKRAFDSITPGTIELAMSRVGIPPDIIQWITAMDQDNVITVRSNLVASNPSLPVETFSAGKGTPQGDICSPDVWNLFFDILLNLIEAASPDPVITVGLDGQLAPSPSTGYADDLASTGQSTRSIQAQADVLSALASAFCFLFAILKLRAFCILAPARRTEKHSFTIHDANWQPHPVSFSPSGSLVYLGAHIPIDPASDSFDQVLLNLRHTLNVLTRRRASAATKLMVLTSSIIPRFSYRCALASWSLQRYRRLDIPIQIFYRAITHNLSSFPSLLLYAAPTMGGLGLPRLSDKIMLAKLHIMLRCQASDDNVQHAMNSMLCRQARASSCLPPPGQVISLTPPQLDPSPSLWASSLVSWLGDTHHVLCCGGRAPHSALDLPAAHMLRPAPALQRQLRSHDIQTLGDLVSASQGRLSWNPPLVRLCPGATPQPPAVPLSLHLESTLATLSLRVGQFWLRSRSIHLSPLYEILAFQQGVPLVATWTNFEGTWDFHRRTTDRTILDWEALGPCPRRVSVQRLRQDGTILARVVKTLGCFTLSAPMITPDALSTLSPYMAGRTIFTDGSWSQPTSLLPLAAMRLAPPTTAVATAAIVATDPDLKPTVGIRLTDGHTCGADSAFPMEMAGLLVAQATSASSPNALWTDCQSAMKLLAHGNYALAPTELGPLILAARRSRLWSGTTHWIQAHADARAFKLTPHQKGNIAADKLAGPQATESPFPFLTIQLHRLASSLINTARIWFVSKDGNPFLSPIMPCRLLHYAHTYISDRNHIRTERGDEECWDANVMRAAASLWSLPSRPLSDRAVVNRIIWKKFWTFEQHHYYPQADQPPEPCPLCLLSPDSWEHWNLHCTDPTLVTIRNRQLIRCSDSWIPPGQPLSQSHHILQSMWNLLSLNTPDCADIWRGLWTPQICARLPLLNSPFPTLGMAKAFHKQWKTGCVALLDGTRDMLRRRMTPTARTFRLSQPTPSSLLSPLSPLSPRPLLSQLTPASQPAISHLPQQPPRCITAFFPRRPLTDAPSPPRQGIG